MKAINHHRRCVLLLCTALIWGLPIGLFGQHTGYKGMRMATGVQTLVSTHPVTAVGLIALPYMKVEFNPAVALEFSLSPKWSLGINGAWRSVGFPYRFDATRYYSIPGNEYEQHSEVIPANSFSYHWYRAGIEMYRYREGYIGPVGRYRKFSLCLNMMRIADESYDLTPWQTVDSLAVQAMVPLIGYGVGNKRVIRERYYVSIGAQVQFRLPIRDFPDHPLFQKRLRYYYEFDWVTDPAKEIARLVDQMMLLNLSVTVGFLW